MNQPPNYQSGYLPPPGYPPLQGYQQQPPKKKSRAPIIIMIVLGAILLSCGLCGVVVAATNHSNTGTVASSLTSTSSTPDGSTPTTTSNQHFKVGDTVTVGNVWKVIVNSVATNPGDGQVYIPQSGSYVVIDVSLTNISSQEQVLSSFDFTLKGMDGTKYDQTFASGLSGVSPPPDGKVEAGDIVKGDLVYDTSAKAFTFAFAPSLFESGQTIWDISVS